jgi:hypothetical protein
MLSMRTTFADGIFGNPSKDMYAAHQQHVSWQHLCGLTLVVTFDLQELSEPGSPAYPEHRANSRQGDDPQLRQLADTMKQQIGALARAVEDLKEVRALALDARCCCCS